MPATFFWFLPTNGDSRSIVGASHASSHHSVPPNYRAPTRRYLAEVARAADRLGYEGVLTPTGTWCEDAWLTASALLAETERLKFLVAFRPGLVPPTLAAQQTATLQRFSEGRVLLNIVSGGDDVEQRRFGDWLGHDERYARTGEFLHIVELDLAPGLPRLQGRVLQRRGRAGVGAAGSVAADLLRRFVGGRAADRRGVRRRLPDLGRAAAGCGGQDRGGPRAGRGSVGATCVSASGCTPSAATPRRRRGRWPTSCGGAQPPSRSPRPDCAACEFGVRRAAADDGAARRPHRTSSRSTRTCGPASGWCAAARAPRWSAATTRSPTYRRVPLAGLRRVHPVGLPAPRGGVLVRRRACSAPEAQRCRLTAVFGYS